ncbi:MAG: hypothetical protein E6Q86_02495 [Tolumonas sp.]|nr:MAG: hypothetical protein E6Q86_02495 [Tolumonas sp.]
MLLNNKIWNLKKCGCVNSAWQKHSKL